MYTIQLFDDDLLLEQDGFETRDDALDYAYPEAVELVASRRAIGILIVVVDKQTGGEVYEERL